jgi:hypothetical protein
VSDTPAFRHVVPIHGETTDQYRLRVLENAVTAMAVRFERHMEQDQKNMLAQASAIERCQRHADDIDSLKASASAESTREIPRRTWADVLFHPATPMAFCIVAMIYFFTLYVSASSGRDMATLVPTSSYLEKK